MLRGIPLIFKKNKYYADLKQRLPESLKLFLQGDINSHKQKLLKMSVNNKPILPAMIGLELTNHCNAKCTFCTQPDIMVRNKDTMKIEVMERVVDQIKKYNVPSVMLGGMGEPFMWKAIISLIKKLSDSGVHISITTNGSMFHRYTPEDIIESGLNELLISMDAIDTKWLHETKPGIKKSVSKIEEEIKKIYDYKIKNKKKSPNIVLKYQILENSNYILDKDKEKEILESKVGKICDSVDLRKQHDWLGGAHEGVGNHTLPNAGMDNICNQLVRSMEISWNGDVGLCCMDYDNKVLLGNIMEEEIPDIFNKKPIQKARKMYVDGNINKHGMCSGCYS